MTEIYPCKDTPKTCGWPGRPGAVCVYPACWCGEWLVEKTFTNKNTTEGQHVEMVLYRGKDNDLAHRIYTHVRMRREFNTPIPLSNNRLSLRIYAVKYDVVEDDYQISIEGNLQ
jgi:hypothetical protein